MVKNKSSFAHNKGYSKKSVSSARKSAVNSIQNRSKQQNDRSGSSYSLSFTTKVVLGFVGFTIAVAGIVSLTKSQLSINEKQKILDDLNTQIAQQQIENEELEQKLNGDLDRYIEDYARDKLDMVKPGERVYINTAGD